MQIVVFTNKDGLKCAGVLIGANAETRTVEVFWDEFYQLKKKMREEKRLKPHDEKSLNPRVSWVTPSERSVIHDLGDKKIAWTTPEHEELYQAHLAGNLEEKIAELRPLLYQKYA